MPCRAFYPARQVPSEALVRLTQGRAAELGYLAEVNGCNSTGDDAAGAKPALRFDSKQFSLLRRESDRFNDGDGSRRSRAKRLQAAAAAASTAAAAGATAAAAESTLSKEEAEEYAVAAEAGVDADAASPGWEGPLPEHGGVLIADGFLVPGKADGGVYLVVPPPAAAASGKKGSAAGGTAGGDDGGARGGERGAGASPTGAGAAAAGERIVRLTGTKRCVALVSAVRTQQSVGRGGSGKRVTAWVVSEPHRARSRALRPWSKGADVGAPAACFVLTLFVACASGDLAFVRGM